MDKKQFEEFTNYINTFFGMNGIYTTAANSKIMSISEINELHKKICWEFWGIA